MKTISRYIMTLALLITAATGAWAEDTYTITFAANNKTVTKENVTLPVTYQCSYNSANRELDLILKELYGWTGGSDRTFCYNWNTPSSSDANKAVAGLNGNDHYITINNVFEGTVTITGVYKVWGNETTYTLEITCPDPNAVEVTTNAASEGATFTEASFNMPASDVTVSYDLVRDMEDETYPVEFDGIPERIVVKEDGSNKYQPITALAIQLIDDISGTDENIIAATGITVKVLKGTDNNGTIEYDEANPLTLAEFTADIQPGYYKIVAEPTDAATSPYTGTVSLAFEALAGYPVEVASKEYVTYYSENDNLTVDDENAQLYTITSVGETAATVTEIASANKTMPFLVYNSSDEKKTIILIPTNNEINQAVAREFVGTPEVTTIAASTDAKTNYAFNGKQFVWVRTALPVAANKAWLEVPTSTARSIALVFADDDATAISAVSGSPADKAAVYDLSGRKVTNPAKKGVYIVNGKKVVVK